MNKFIYKFPEIDDEFRKVTFSQDNGKSWDDFKIVVKDSHLDARYSRNLPSISTDLIDLSSSIFIADWLCFRKLDGRPAEINLIIPVRNHNLFSNESTIKKLQQLLGWFTGDHWDFHFKKRKSKRDVEHQSVLEFELNSEIEVALWSGGLDSLAGLYYRYKEYTERKYILVGTGFNKTIIGKQKSIYKGLRDQSPIHAELRQIRFYPEDSDINRKHSFMRSRGLAFMLIGAATSLAMKQQKLHIYENGIGAFNLPYRRSEVGLEHSRSVHPTSLLKTSEFISSLIQDQFEIINPFNFHTKAQICKPIINDGLIDLIYDTITCDSKHRSNPSQCGYCSSCLLRRQSLKANNIEDNTGYVLTEGNTKSNSLYTHIDAVLHQVNFWQTTLYEENEMKERWGKILNQYPELESTVRRMAAKSECTEDEIKYKIINMYRAYCEEWNITKGSILKTYPNQIN